MVIQFISPFSPEEKQKWKSVNKSHTGGFCPLKPHTVRCCFVGALAGPHIWSRHWHLKYFRLQETAVLGWPCRPPQCRMSVYRAGGQTSHGRTSPGDERTTLKCHVQTLSHSVHLHKWAEKGRRNNLQVKMDQCWTRFWLINREIKQVQYWNLEWQTVNFKSIEPELGKRHAASAKWPLVTQLEFIFSL